MLSLVGTQMMGMQPQEVDMRFLIVQFNNFKKRIVEKLPDRRTIPFEQPTYWDPIWHNHIFDMQRALRRKKRAAFKCYSKGCRQWYLFKNELTAHIAHQHAGKFLCKECGLPITKHTVAPHNRKYAIRHTMGLLLCTQCGCHFDSVGQRKHREGLCHLSKDLPNKSALSQNEEYQ